MQVIRPKKKKNGHLLPMMAVTVALIIITAFLFIYVVQNAGGITASAEPSYSQVSSEVSASSQDVLVYSRYEPPEPSSSSAVQKMPQDRFLVLVNKNHKIPDSFQLDLVTFKNVQMDKTVSEAYNQMYEAAAEAGVNIWISSAYRSTELQAKLFMNEIQQNMKNGMTEEEAEKAAELLVQRPGYSEHATGLALDFNGVSSNFEHDEAYLWLNEHAAEYGFVLRYPTDKVNLTGIDYEPWHFRYVGRENAEKMNELGYCLEEYIDYLMAEPESSENVSGAQAE